MGQWECKFARTRWCSEGVAAHIHMSRRAYQVMYMMLYHAGVVVAVGDMHTAVARWLVEQLGDEGSIILIRSM